MIPKYFTWVWSLVCFSNETLIEWSLVCFSNDTLIEWSLVCFLNDTLISREPSWWIIMFTYSQLLDFLHLISFVLCAPPVCQFAPKFQCRVLAFLKAFCLVHPKKLSWNKVEIWAFFPSNGLEYVSLESQGLNPE
jgi:hypothetical protein